MSATDQSFVSAVQSSMYDFEDALDCELEDGSSNLDAKQRAAIEKQSERKNHMSDRKKQLTDRKRISRHNRQRQKSSLMNRSANYMLDMLEEEEDEGGLNQFKSLEQREFSSFGDEFREFDGPSFNTQRKQATATGYLKV